MIRPLNIRPARTTDADLIAAVYVEAWRTAYPGLVPNGVLVQMSQAVQAREWTVALSRRRLHDTVMIAEEAATVVGFGSCGESRDRTLPHAGEIYTLYVQPEHHERGIGRALLFCLFDALTGRGLNSAVVWVLSGNPARFFYEAMGGRKVAERTQKLWNKQMRQTAYGWDDLRIVARRRIAPD